MRCLVIGKGRWGNRICAALNELGYETDANGHSIMRCARDWEFRSEAFDAVFIATPAETHARIVQSFLERGTPVFCEKPFTTNLQDAETLCDLWVKKQRPVFLVDHVQLFNDALKTWQTPTEMTIRARGPGPFREHCSALWDWGSHAIADAMYLTRCLKPELLSAISEGPVVVPQGIAEMVNLSVKLNDSVAVMSIGNAAKDRARNGRVAFDSAYFGNVTATYDAARTHPPPLTTAVKTFLQYLREPDKARGDVRFGMELPVAVVRFLTQVDEALAAKGIPRPQVQQPTLV